MAAAKRRTKPEGVRPESATPGPAVAQTVLSFATRHSRLLSLAFVLLASVRILATYTVFNHTSDEPAHIACGMEWLDKGAYTWEPQHPPLARVASALGPYLIGRRSPNTTRVNYFSMFSEGMGILYQGHQYDRTLFLARLGILPFVWLACAVVYWWGEIFYGRAIALAALFLFSFLPSILAHGGLATTDMALTATMCAAFLGGMIWLEHPTPGRAALFGLAAGLMTLSKFSAIAFFPASVGLVLALYIWRERANWRGLITEVGKRIPTFAIALLVGAMTIWAGYRFSFGDSGIAHLRLPAPELFAGIRQVQEHNAAGHVSYFLGKMNNTGSWLFFPIVLAVKTPVAFLILVLAGLWLAFRDRTSPSLLVPIGFSAGILLVGMSSRINLGVRHILPIYAGLSLIAAVALVRLVEQASQRKWLAAAMPVGLLWLLGSSLLSHPDYLPYFNEFAGSEPEKIVADSDLDWGQDLKRLSTRLREAGATAVSFDKYIVGDWEKEHGFPKIYQLNPASPSEGWNAVGVGLWKESRLVVWPDWIKPQERVGKSILLWYYPPSNGGAPAR